VTTRLRVIAWTLVAACAAPGALRAQHHGTHWTYEGATGPAHWGSLDTAFAKCAKGHAQSPIDIAAPAGGTLSAITVKYQPTKINVVNNGHTIQVNYDSGSAIEVDGVRYKLIQFHFHVPSEHTIGGKPAAAELHLVHRSAKGHLAVIGVLMEVGAENAALAPLWAHLPAKAGPAQKVDARINAADLLPASHTTYRYNGSLTTPPCSEGVQWMVMTTPITVSDQQLASLKAILHGNNRPVQAIDGRTISSDAK